MTILITGKINGGKTSRMLALSKEQPCGDGFISPKVFSEGVFIGYDIQHLSTGETYPFIRRKDSIPAVWDEAFIYGAYSFSQKALERAEGIIDKAISNKNFPLYIDEIGPVELAGRGFATLLERALKAGCDLCLAVRESCLDDVVQRFGINEYELLRIE